jgi:4-hydroxy-tetrahydrodipicolinate synthase
MSTDPARPFGRVLTAMVTPFSEDGEIDLAGTQELAAQLVDRGAHDGLVIHGTTGESPTTTDAEQHAVLEAVLDAVGDRAVVVAGVGTNDTAHSIEKARDAERLGAHGLLVVTPYYNKPPQSGLVAHFTTVADATSLPVMLYDIPARSGVAIHTETLVQLAEHPRIVAVKDAKNDLYEGAWVLERSDLELYSGTDELNLAWMAHGASGIVSVVAHAAAPQYRRMIDACVAGDFSTARAVNSALLPAVRGIMTRTQGAIMAKAALELQGVLPGRQTRLPLLAATNEEVGLLRTDLMEAQLL